MKIFAIGDPHLGNLEKMIQRFNYPPNYFTQLADNIARENPDILLIAGDLTWNKDFSDATTDLQSLQSLKAGNICFIEGNHDAWLPDYSQMYQIYNTSHFYFLSGRTFYHEKIGICGIRGTDKDAPQTTREIKLIENALRDLSKADIDLAICVIHHLPTSQIFKNPEESFAEDHYFTLMEEYNINKVVYGHAHEDHNVKINLYMKVDSIELYCCSIDYFNWSPVRIL
ncbi:MAG TPA: metallophosphoesterase [Candidatus Deferrimicrobium sp.]|nr:metallophosphoesterase [Candidatus Deferrimicrobium sp.]